MPFLNLGSEVCLERVSRDSGAIKFNIEKVDAVDAFMANEAMLSFLRDPFLDGDTYSGCGIMISREGTSLTFTPNEGSAGIARLVSALKTYVIPYDESEPYNTSDWSRVSGAARLGAPTEIPALSLPRGEAILHPDGDPEPPHLTA